MKVFFIFVISLVKLMILFLYSNIIYFLYIVPFKGFASDKHKKINTNKNNTSKH